MVKNNKQKNWREIFIGTIIGLIFAIILFLLLFVFKIAALSSLWFHYIYGINIWGKYPNQVAAIIILGLPFLVCALIGAWFGFVIKILKKNK